eukprot:TRINITY_DN35999_c0_g1_i1.p2 TRINITY_DN35999_c0_g1~~TRINITY_DN35999_c0_g1_i1.p2  ORF type:complete len:169 (+),score=35.13 TRINITY_DN35999_c0_g1_i1:185-691(+)
MSRRGSEAGDAGGRTPSQAGGGGTSTTRQYDRRQVDDRIVFFDDDPQNPSLHILDPVKYTDSSELMQASSNFGAKLNNFQEMISGVMAVVQQLGERIEHEKLRATGVRNKVETEAETRKVRKEELALQLREKRVELDRFVAEHRTLEHVEREQRQLISRLWGPEGGDN